MLSATGFGSGGVAGLRGACFVSDIFGDGSLFEGPRMLAKDIGLLDLSGLCGIDSAFLLATVVQKLTSFDCGRESEEDKSLGLPFARL